MELKRTWNMAQARQRQRLRRYVKVAAVGEPVDWNQPGLSGEQACNGCGRHVCSCKKPRRCMLCEFVDCKCNPTPLNTDSLAAQLEKISQSRDASLGMRPKPFTTYAKFRPLTCGEHAVPLVSCVVCRAVDEANRASMRLPTDGQRGTASDVVGILALCLECTGKRPGDPHYCKRGDCQCAECHAHPGLLGAYVRELER